MLPRPAAVSIALAGAFLVGVLTSVGQSVAGPLGTLANSAGPWFVVALGLVLLARARLAWALPLGVVLLLLMHVGYTVATNLRGHPDSISVTNPWVVLALPAGLLAGACATAMRSGDERWRSGAFGVVAAITVGEGVSALLRVAASTSASFWFGEIVLGVIVAVVGLAVARTPLGRVVVLGTAVVGAAGVLGAFLLLGGG